MKVTYRIPQAEQYSYVEVEMELEGMTVKMMPYNEVKAWFEESKGGPGLSEADFRVILDKYMTTHTMTAEEYEAMNAVQQNVIQCLKKAYKRQEARSDRESRIDFQMPGPGKGENGDYSGMD